MWWDQLKEVKHFDEKRISWSNFKGYFQEKYFPSIIMKQR
jgi:hypothetical protein